MHPNPRECVLVELMENCFVRVHNRHMWIRILIEREQLTLSGLAREQLAGCVSFQKKKTFVLKIHCIEVANETSFQLEWIIKCLGEWKHNWALIRSNQYSINQIKKQSWFMHGKVSSRERESDRIIAFAYRENFEQMNRLNVWSRLQWQTFDLTND